MSGERERRGSASRSCKIVPLPRQVGLRMHTREAWERLRDSPGIYVLHPSECTARNEVKVGIAMSVAARLNTYCTYYVRGLHVLVVAYFFHLPGGMTPGGSSRARIAIGEKERELRNELANLQGVKRVPAECAARTLSEWYVVDNLRLFSRWVAMFATERLNATAVDDFSEEEDGDAEET